MKLNICLLRNLEEENYNNLYMCCYNFISKSFISMTKSLNKQVLAATQTPGESGKNWFQGTADAVRQFTWVFEVSMDNCSYIFCAISKKTH